MPAIYPGPTVIPKAGCRRRAVARWKTGPGDLGSSHSFGKFGWETLGRPLPLWVLPILCDEGWGGGAASSRL